MLTTTQRPFFVFGQVLATLIAVSTTVLAETSKPNLHTKKIELSTAEIQKIWQSIENRNIQRFQATWNATITLNANPSMDVERYKNTVMADGKAAGAEKKPEQWKASTQSAEHFANAIKRGTVLKQSLEVSRVGNVIRFDVKPQDESRSKTPYIDFYDGKNAVTLFPRTRMKNGDFEIDNSKPFRGAVTRDPEEILGGSAPFGQSILLAQEPITHYFDRVNSQLEKRGSYIVLTEKKAKTFKTALLQLVLKDTDLSPVSLQHIALYGLRKGQVEGGHRVEAYREISGVQIPSRIVYSDRVSHKPGGQRIELVLQNAAINNSVDVSSILLPAGAEVGDYRFGKEKGVKYKITDGHLLTDAQVQKLLGALPQPSKSTAVQQSSFPITSLLGLALIALGGALWIKTGRKQN